MEYEVKQKLITYIFIMTEKVSLKWSSSIKIFSPSIVSLMLKFIYFRVSSQILYTIK
jgi:hypothetical protein